MSSEPVTQPNWTAYANGRVEEFHNRLKLKVQRLTCDVCKNEADFLAYLKKQDERSARSLALILYKELIQVIKAVEEAK